MFHFLSPKELPEPQQTLLGRIAENLTRLAVTESNENLSRQSVDGVPYVT